MAFNFLNFMQFFRMNGQYNRGWQPHPPIWGILDVPLKVIAIHRIASPMFPNHGHTTAFDWYYSCGV